MPDANPCTSTHVLLSAGTGGGKSVTVRPGTTVEAIALIGAAAAAGTPVVVADIPADGLLLGGAA